MDIVEFFTQLANRPHHINNNDTFHQILLNNIRHFDQSTNTTSFNTYADESMINSRLSKSISRYSTFYADETAVIQI